MATGVEEVLDRLDEVLDRSVSVPLSGGKCVVDAEKMRDMIDDIRIHLPAELKQAQAVMTDRASILANARRESEEIIRKAEERAKALLSQEQIVKHAQARAADMENQSKGNARQIKQASFDFSDRTLQQTEEALCRSLAEVRGTRQALKETVRQQRAKG